MPGDLALLDTGLPVWAARWPGPQAAEAGPLRRRTASPPHRNRDPCMTDFRLTPAVAEVFPDALLAVVTVTVTGLRRRDPWPHTAAVEELAPQLADGARYPADETDPRIAAWHSACRSFGSHPRRVRPSVDALGRRLTKGQPASDQPGRRLLQRRLRPARPAAGAFDRDHVAGVIDLRCAGGADSAPDSPNGAGTEPPRAPRGRSPGRRPVADRDACRAAAPRDRRGQEAPVA